MRSRGGISDDEIGLRSFGLQRGRAVEAAVARIRHGIGPSWDLFLSEEIEVLEWILGETWAMMGFRAWERVGFSFATPELVEEIIILGESVIAGKAIGLTAVRKVKTLLAGLPSPGKVSEAGDS